MSAGRPVADALGKVGHVLEPNVGGKWIDDREIQLVDLDWVLSIDACIAGPERDVSCPRIDQPSVLVVGLIRQGRGDLPNVDLGQDKHLLRLEPSRGALKDHEGCVLTLSQIAKGRMARPVHDQRHPDVWLTLVLRASR